MSAAPTRASSMPLPARAPVDQAQGLRRLFAGRGHRVLALAANPWVSRSGALLDRVAAVLATMGRQVLVVDAADSSPAPGELGCVDLAACIERVAPRVSYLPARGLPLAHVDTRGSAAGFIDALQRAAPDADVVLLHADAMDLARLLKQRAARPLLIGADDPDSIKHAYASCKLLVRRCSLMSFDLLLAATPRSTRAPAIAASLRSCADGFVGAALRDWAQIDPAGDPAAGADDALLRLLGAQLDLDEAALPHDVGAHDRAAVFAPITPIRSVLR